MHIARACTPLASRASTHTAGRLVAHTIAAAAAGTRAPLLPCSFLQPIPALRARMSTGDAPSRPLASHRDSTRLADTATDSGSGSASASASNARVSDPAASSPSLQLVPAAQLQLLPSALASVGALHDSTFGDWVSWAGLCETLLPNEEILVLTQTGRCNGGGGAEPVNCASSTAVPLGYAVMRHFPTARTFLRFLVVSPGQRGSGVGSAAWPLLLRHVSSTGRLTLCWDVEHPRQSGLSAEERSLRARRVAFYQRLGATLLPLANYSNPHGDGAEVPMLLFAQGADGAAGPLAGSEAELDALAENIRRDVDRHK